MADNLTSMPEHSTARQRVEFGLDSIPPDRTVTVGLRDLMFIHQTLAEFMQFFHQDLHYPDLAAVNRFLQQSGCGAFDVLREALYNRMHSMLPPDIHAAFGEGERFEHPLPPKYFTPTDGDDA
jgi:hypothetical protein